MVEFFTFVFHLTVFMLCATAVALYAVAIVGGVAYCIVTAHDRLSKKLRAKRDDPFQQRIAEAEADQSEAMIPPEFMKRTVLGCYQEIEDLKAEVTTHEQNVARFEAERQKLLDELKAARDDHEHVHDIISNDPLIDPIPADYTIRVQRYLTDGNWATCVMIDDKTWDEQEGDRIAGDLRKIVRFIEAGMTTVDELPKPDVQGDQS